MSKYLRINDDGSITLPERAIRIPSEVVAKYEIQRERRNNIPGIRPMTFDEHIVADINGAIGLGYDAMGFTDAEEWVSSVDLVRESDGGITMNCDINISARAVENSTWRRRDRQDMLKCIEDEIGQILSKRFAMALGMTDQDMEQIAGDFMDQKMDRELREIGMVDDTF